MTISFAAVAGTSASLPLTNSAMPSWTNEFSRRRPRRLASPAIVRHTHADGSAYRKQSLGNFSIAPYAFVLHGPPGSSKTAIAQAFSAQMWRSTQRGQGRKPRMIRITPADFTRHGEHRLDYEARLIFDLISRVRGTVILFDEIDDLLRARKQADSPSFLDLIVPAMLEPSSGSPRLLHSTGDMLHLGHELH